MIPVSVLIPTRNERENIVRVLEPLRGWADQIVVVDSHSTDGTVEAATAAGAEVVQFDYSGGWPKKRQWALDTFPFRNDWILLLDADEILLPAIKDEIARAITDRSFDGYWLRFQNYFMGRQLRYGDTQLWKLFLFRNGKGRYEKRLASQDASMSDIEIHEHVVVEGNVGRLRNPIRHENVHSLDRYIHKHNEYSNWESKVLLEGSDNDVRPSLFGTQAQRRRWLKRKLMNVPGSPVLVFFYRYLFRLGILDGKAGLLYCGFHAVQMFHTKAKMHEQRLRASGR
jgi:glycosyltransferase involved in cell wall biosynthesis